MLLLPSLACMGYAQRDTPLVLSTTDVVRIPFTHARQLIVWHETPFPEHDALPASQPDTMRQITSVYGRVIHQRGDTLVLALTKVGRDGTAQWMPKGSYAVVDRRETRPIERWGHNENQTIALAVAVGAVIVAAAIAFASLVSATAEGT